MSMLLYRLGRWCAVRRRTVVSAWAGLLVVLIIGVVTVGGHVVETFTLPGTESQDARDLLDERFPAAAGSSATVVVSGDDLQGEQRTDVEALAASLADIDGITAVSDPYGPANVARDGSVLLFNVQFAEPATDVSDATFGDVNEVIDATRSDQLQVEVGGEVAAEIDRQEPGGTTELIGIAVAMVVLLISFGSIVAMGLPLFTALTGVGISIASILLLAAVWEIPSIAETLGLMLGLAVGIDYALFILSRHREQLQADLDVTESIGRSVATAGGSVVFAGFSVMIAMLGLVVVGIPFITLMAYCVAFAVFVAIVVAITLLPALLGFAGPRLRKATLPVLRDREIKPQHDRMGHRWSEWVTRRPWRSFLGALAIIGVLAIPLLSLDTAMPSDGTAPESSSRRQAYDLVADGFGPGFNSPLQVVIDHQGVDDQQVAAAVTSIQSALDADDDVLAVFPPATNPDGDTTIVQAIPNAGPTAESTSALLDQLRNDTLPPIETASNVTTYVAGPTALNIDIDDKLARRLPWVMAIVIGLTFVLLMVAFRSILVPLKASIGILLSIAAALGVVVAVFQWGWGASLIGVDTTQPIISFLPVMAFAILFGLSMDYEVFILSRVREEWLRTGNAHDSVINGVGVTARVITAAAAIMISVFGGFILGDDPTIKMVGLGLAVSVLIDATLVRMVLVPSTMVMFDKANWWLPRWLDRLIPNVDIEGEKLLEQLEHDDLDHELAELTGPPVTEPSVPAGAD